MRVLVPLGTRPEIVKLAPVVEALRAHGVQVRVVATGQHYDASLTDAFYDSLGLHPDERWDLAGDEPDRVSGILAALLRELADRPADLLLVLGDTYTVPLACLAARRHRTPVVHVEAGLRSFNENVPWRRSTVGSPRRPPPCTSSRPSSRLVSCGTRGSLPSASAWSGTRLSTCFVGEGRPRSRCPRVGASS